MIWWLHINFTVYNQYPTLAILAHKNLEIDALLGLEMTITWFSFKTQLLEIKHIYQSLSRCWVTIYPKQIILLFVEGTFTRKTNCHFPYSLLNKLW